MEEKRRRRRRRRRKKIQLRESQWKEDPHVRNVRKVANRCVFSMICGPAGSKNRLAKAVSVYRRNEKLHAAETRSTFASRKVQNTTGSDHFLELRCGKMAHRCNEKHICKSSTSSGRNFHHSEELKVVRGNLGTEIDQSVQNDKKRQRGTFLYGLLSGVLKQRPLMSLKQVANSNGFSQQSQRNYRNVQWAIEQVSERELSNKLDKIETN